MNAAATEALRGGLYLVVDPAPDTDRVLTRVEAAIHGGVTAVQVWNHFAAEQDARTFVAAVAEMAHSAAIPVLVHERPDLLSLPAVAGIHFDVPTHEPAAIRTIARRPVLYGVTCGNDLERTRWAAAAGVDYISFCSMFPSVSADACELVQPATLRAARAVTSMPIVASGGITPENAADVIAAGADAIAVISGILSARDPCIAAARYRSVIDAHYAGDHTP